MVPLEGLGIGAPQDLCKLGSGKLVPAAKPKDHGADSDTWS